MTDTPIVEPTPSTLTSPAPPLPEPAPTVTPKTTAETLYAGTGDTPPGDTAPAATAPTSGSPSDDKPASKEGEEAKVVTPTEPSPLTVESYKDLALPEGLSAEDPVNAGLFTQFKETAAELGITPEAAPKLLSLWKTATDAQTAATETFLANRETTWAKELSTIPEFAGSRAETARSVIGRAMEEFGGTPDQVSELRTLLDTHRLGNAPALARLVYNMAVGLVEGTAPTPGTPVNPTPTGPAANRGKTNGQVLYPSLETQQ